MSDKTGIEWTDATWNPVTGCDEVSPGCDHCYAKTFAERWRGTPGHHFEMGFDVTLRPERLDQPIRWKKPRRVFVNSMSDLFHKDIPDDYVAQVFAVMGLAPWHTFQLLTKRHARMRSLLSSDDFRGKVLAWVDTMLRDPKSPVLPGNRWAYRQRANTWSPLVAWPLPNVWLGVSVENQQWADIRIPALLDTPAAVRFLSCEPLLGPVDLTAIRRGIDALSPDWAGGPSGGTGAPHALVNWVIVGGESGHGARPMHPAWAGQLRDQCNVASVPFLFKQWGEWAPDEWVDDDGSRHVNLPSDHRDPTRLVIHRAGMTAMHPGNPFNPFERGHPHWNTAMRRVGKKAAGRELDGRTWDEYPGVAS